MASNQIHLEALKLFNLVCVRGFDLAIIRHKLKDDFVSLEGKKENKIGKI
jgi:uncharacterized protein (UPF0210 family)